MASSPTKLRRPKVARYLFATAAVLLTAVSSATGAHWYFVVIGVSTAAMLFLGRRRIFRAGVVRSAEGVICRYIPWYEGNAYALLVLLPALGFAAIGAGREPGNPAWLRLAGFVLLIAALLFFVNAAIMWRRCILCFSPTDLTVRLAGPKDRSTTIRRERITAISPVNVSNAINRAELRQVKVAYGAPDSAGRTSSNLLLGLQFSVEPVNLLRALAAWREGADSNPEQLLDRIENILRGDLENTDTI